MSAAALETFAFPGSIPVAAVAALVVRGLAYGGVSVGSQTWTPQHASEVPEAATALLARAFNPAIALGALLGGRVADGFRTSDSRRN